MRCGWFARINAQANGCGGTDSSPKFSNRVCVKGAGRPRLTECSDNGIGLHFLEGVWNFSFRLFFSRAASREQQMELSAADETYVPDADALVVMGRGRLPGYCRMSDDVHRCGREDHAVP